MLQIMVCMSRLRKLWVWSRVLDIFLAENIQSVGGILLFIYFRAISRMWRRRLFSWWKCLCVFDKTQSLAMQPFQTGDSHSFLSVGSDVLFCGGNQNLSLQMCSSLFGVLKTHILPGLSGNWVCLCF